MRLRKPRRGLTIRVDNDRCELYGICAVDAPSVFRLGESRLRYDRGVDKADRFGEFAELSAAIAAAARNCPMQAIRVQERT